MEGTGSTQKGFELVSTLLKEGPQIQPSNKHIQSVKEGPQASEKQISSSQGRPKKHAAKPPSDNVQTSKKVPKAKLPKDGDVDLSKETPKQSHKETPLVSVRMRPFSGKQHVGAQPDTQSSKESSKETRV